MRSPRHLRGFWLCGQAPHTARQKKNHHHQAATTHQTTHQQPRGPGLGTPWQSRKSWRSRTHTWRWPHQMGLQRSSCLTARPSAPFHLALAPSCGCCVRSGILPRVFFVEQFQRSKAFKSSQVRCPVDPTSPSLCTSISRYGTVVCSRQQLQNLCYVLWARHTHRLCDLRSRQVK
jgi:hypothetical protein